MGKRQVIEIKELGGTKWDKAWITYEGGEKVAITRHVAEPFNPEGKYITRDYKTNEIISETRHMPHPFNREGQYKTWDGSGKLIAETQHLPEPFNTKGVYKTWNSNGKVVDESRHMPYSLNPAGTVKSSGDSPLGIGAVAFDDNLEKKLADRKGKKHDKPKTPSSGNAHTERDNTHINDRVNSIIASDKANSAMSHGAGIPKSHHSRKEGYQTAFMRDIDEFYANNKQHMGPGARALTERMMRERYSGKPFSSFRSTEGETTERNTFRMKDVNLFYEKTSTSKYDYVLDKQVLVTKDSPGRLEPPIIYRINVLLYVKKSSTNEWLKKSIMSVLSKKLELKQPIFDVSIPEDYWRLKSDRFSDFEPGNFHLYEGVVVDSELSDLRVFCFDKGIPCLYEFNQYNIPELEFGYVFPFTNRIWKDPYLSRKELDERELYFHSWNKIKIFYNTFETEEKATHLPPNSTYINLVLSMDEIYPFNSHDTNTEDRTKIRSILSRELKLEELIKPADASWFIDDEYHMFSSMYSQEYHLYYGILSNNELHDLIKYCGNNNISHLDFIPKLTYSKAFPFRRG